MKREIKKNRRRPFPFFNPFIPVIIRRHKSFIIRKYFMFTDSTMYFFNDEDQYDVNKLFGFSIGYHHNNSYRFGWRPNISRDKMEIVGYEYHNKVRVPTIPICEVELNKWYRYEMIFFSITREIKYCVYDENDVAICGDTRSPMELKHRLSFGYRLYLYFGGNKKSPHDMIIYKK